MITRRGCGLHTCVLKAGRLVVVLATLKLLCWTRSSLACERQQSQDVRVDAGECVTRAIVTTAKPSLKLEETRWMAGK